MKNGLTVVCASQGDLTKYEQIVKKTCGVSNIEFIGFPNNKKGLPELYNKAIKNSKNDIIVFIHDDLEFNTNNWGKKLLTHFNKSDYGVLGLAGSTDIPENGMWWQDSTKMVGIVNHKHEGRKWESKYSNNFGKEIIETILIDGLFIAIDRTKIKEYFNEKVKFHFYDLYFSLGNHFQGVKVGVIFDVRVTHLSIGQTNQEWEETRQIFVKDMEGRIPYNIKPVIRYKEVNISLKNEPKIAIIIPTKSKLNLLFQTIDSIYEKSNYSNYEILIADTGSSDEEKEKIKKYITNHNNIKLIEYDYYNFGKINNDVVKNHVSDDTKYLLFSNNDIKLINDAISLMVQEAEKNKNFGTIGCRLHYSDNTIQHSGIVLLVFKNQSMGVTHFGLKSYYRYYEYKGDVLGNTAAFMLTPKELFNKIGGFNESYIECFEDVEYNMQCILNGRKNIFLGDAVAYHFESQSRNEDPNQLKRINIDWSERLQPFIVTHKEITKYINKI